MPMARPTMLASASGVLKTRSWPYFLCRPEWLEDAALPFYMFQVFVAAGVGDVFAENSDALVARHFVRERGGDHFDHRFGSAVKLRLSAECRRRGIDVGRIDVDENGIDGGRLGG